MRLLILLAVICSIALPSVAQTPDVVARVRPAHPRLIMTDATLPALRKALAEDAWIKSRYAKQKDAADKLLTAKPSEYVIPDGIRLLTTSRAVLDRVATLAIVYRVEGDAKYRDRCWAELDAAAKFKDWNPSHFLDTAEMTAAFAIGYDWLHADWTPDQRAALRRAIIDKGLKPAINVYDNRYNWWPSVTNNWNVVCNGGISMGALAVANETDTDEDAAAVKRVLAEALKSVPRCLSEFGDDGAWPEGPSYWGYTTLFEAMYLDSLRTACGTDFGLVDGAGKGIAQAGWFPAYVSGPTGRVFNFADAGEATRPEGGAQLLWMARRFDEPRYAAYQAHAGTGRVAALELLWAPALPRPDWTTVPVDRHFRGVEVATMRDNWSDPNAWFVAFKAGSNAVSHSHLDLGSYVLENQGVRWVIDLGAENYNLPGYWDKKDKRWSYYRLRAEGHNTLVINPGKGPDQAPSAATKITSFNTTDTTATLTADLTPAYPAAQKVERTLTFTRGQSLTVTDQITLKSPADVYSFLHTRAKVTISPDARSATLSDKDKTLRLTLLEPATAKLESGKAAPLPTSPNPEKQNPNDGITRIAIRVGDVRETAISYRITK